MIITESRHSKGSHIEMRSRRSKRNYASNSKAKRCGTKAKRCGTKAKSCGTKAKSCGSGNKVRSSRRGGGKVHGHGVGHQHGGYQCRRQPQTGGYQCRRPAQTGGTSCGKAHKPSNQNGGNINGKPLIGGAYKSSGAPIMKGGKCKPNHIHPMKGGRVGPAVAPISK